MVDHFLRLAAACRKRVGCFRHPARRPRRRFVQFARRILQEAPGAGDALIRQGADPLQFHRAQFHRVTQGIHLAVCGVRRFRYGLALMEQNLRDHGQQVRRMIRHFTDRPRLAVQRGTGLGHFAHGLGPGYLQACGSPLDRIQRRADRGGGLRRGGNDLFQAPAHGRIQFVQLARRFVDRRIDLVAGPFDSPPSVADLFDRALGNLAQAIGMEAQQGRHLFQVGDGLARCITDQGRLAVHLAAQLTQPFDGLGAGVRQAQQGFLQGLGGGFGALGRGLNPVRAVQHGPRDRRNIGRSLVDGAGKAGFRFAQALDQARDPAVRRVGGGGKIALAAYQIGAHRGQAVGGGIRGLGQFVAALGHFMTEFRQPLDRLIGDAAQVFGPAAQFTTGLFRARDRAFGIFSKLIGRPLQVARGGIGLFGDALGLTVQIVDLCRQPVARLGQAADRTVDGFGNGGGLAAQSRTGIGRLDHGLFGNARQRIRIIAQRR